jgi:hypothetical protein
MGKIHFDQLNPYACDKYAEMNEIGLDRSDDITPFYLAERGGDCSFVQKVRHMEDVGVAVGIIIDN